MSNWLRSDGELPVKPGFWLWFSAYALLFTSGVRGCVYVKPGPAKGAAASTSAQRPR